MNIPSYVSGTIYVTAYRTLRGRIAACLQRFDLTPTTWSLLGIVMQARDGVRLNEAAKILSVKAPLVTMLANELIEKDIITRIPHHIDKRAKLLVMTPKGRKFVSAVEREMDKELQYLLQGTTESDLKSYKKVLDTIIANGEN